MNIKLTLGDAEALLIFSLDEIITIFNFDRFVLIRFFNFDFSHFKLPFCSIERC